MFSGLVAFSEKRAKNCFFTQKDHFLIVVIVNNNKCFLHKSQFLSAC